MTARLLRALAAALVVACCLPAVHAGRLARITHYYATGSPMASGYYPYVGAVACSYDLPLYSWVTVGGDAYECLDRGGLGDGSAGYSWLDFYGFPAEDVYGTWAEIETP